MAVDLTRAKDECRVSGSGHDDRIQAALDASIADVEKAVGMKLTRGSVTQKVSEFGNYIKLVWGPDASDVSVAYTDGDGEAATITDARLVGARLYPPDAGWPTIYTNTPIFVTYTAGFENADKSLDYAVILSLKSYFDNGAITPEVKRSVDSLCFKFLETMT